MLMLPETHILTACIRDSQIDLAKDLLLIPLLFTFQWSTDSQPTQSKLFVDLFMIGLILQLFSVECQQRGLMDKSPDWHAEVSQSTHRQAVCKNISSSAVECFISV
ncbi:hypothetical protein BsWGS_20754 [Bradybaena similaris]